MKNVDFFKIICGCNFNSSQTYLALHRTVEVDWNSNGHVGCPSYSVGDGIVSEITSKEIPGRNRSLAHEVIVNNLDTVRFSFHVNHLFSLAGIRELTMVALCPSEKLKN